MDQVKIFLASLLIFLNNIAYSQKPCLPLIEKTALLTDRPIYLTGENILFKALVFDQISNTFSDFSKNLFVELIDIDNNPVVQGRVDILNGMGHGLIKIPENLNSGNYVISAYTNYMKNSGSDHFFYSYVQIYNQNKVTLVDYDTIGFANSLKESKLINFDEQSKIPLRININQKSFQTRELIQLDIDHNSKNIIYYTLSVYPKEVQDWSQSNPVKVYVINSSQKKISDPFLPEINGFQISGKIHHNQNSRSVSNIGIFLSVKGKQCYNQYFKTLDNGLFIFSVPSSVYHSDCIINTLQEDFTIKPHPFFSDENKNFKSEPYQIDSGAKTVLKKLYINQQIQNIHSSCEISQYEIKDFFGLPDHTIKMSDYVKLPVMEEVFRELMRRYLILIQENGVMKIKVLDRHLNRVIGNSPGFIVDGIMVFDPGLILNLEPEQLLKIEVVCSRYYFGQLVMDGIVKITTKQGKGIESSANTVYSAKLPTNFTIQKINFVNYHTTNSKSSPKPDFRNTLFWNPDIVKIGNINQTVSFYTSDQSGEFVVVARGYAPNGEYYYGETSFRVIE